MPAGVVYVGRPTKWGNPWTLKGYWDAGYSGSPLIAADACVENYRAWLTQTRSEWGGSTIDIVAVRGKVWPRPDISELAGKDLACWCSLDCRCHADVLLELANDGR